MAKRDPDRDRRLADALRRNLRRRKEQARAVEGERSEPGDARLETPPRNGED
jgi:hypothetical protein